MSLLVTAPSKLALPVCIGGITMRFLRVTPLTFKGSIKQGKYDTVAINCNQRAIITYQKTNNKRYKKTKMEI
jgi:hypothetical protein